MHGRRGSWILATWLQPYRRPFAPLASIPLTPPVRLHAVSGMSERPGPELGCPAQGGAGFMQGADNLSKCLDLARFVVGDFILLAERFHYGLGGPSFICDH